MSGNNKFRSGSRFNRRPGGDRQEEPQPAERAYSEDSESSDNREPRRQEVHYPIQKWGDASQSTFERERIVAGNKGHGASDQFDMLRTKILREMRANGWRTLGITSPMPRCGKTTIAINLSISIAKGIHKDIVLVDLDLRNPTIADYLGIDPSPDLSDFLEGRISFRDPFINPGIPRLLILPNKTPHLHSSELLTSRAASNLARKLRAMEDVQLVVYDLPPALPTDDTLAFTPEVDCVLIVVGDGVTTKRELEETQELLKDTHVLGYVLNQV